jgi:hypothetical protein
MTATGTVTVRQYLRVVLLPLFMSEQVRYSLDTDGRSAAGLADLCHGSGQQSADASHGPAYPTVSSVGVGDCGGEVQMVPNGESGRRIYRPVRRTRKTGATQPLNEAKRQAILHVIDQYNRFGPKQVHAELRRTRHDITLPMVHTVFQQLGRSDSRITRIFRQRSKGK